MIEYPIKKFQIKDEVTVSILTPQQGDMFVARYRNADLRDMVKITKYYRYDPV
jgi:hypothetical protein